MRFALILAVGLCTLAGHAFAQGGVTMPADADMRAMQAPSDWEGSRAQHTQEPDGTPSPAFARPVAPAPAPAASLDPAHPDFTVDVWDDQNHLVETMAHCSDLIVGKAAFTAAASERPQMKVTLREGSTYISVKDAGKVAAR